MSSSSFSEPESPLDVLSRAATMVEKSVIVDQNSRDETQSPTSTNSVQNKGIDYYLLLLLLLLTLNNVNIHKLLA